MMDFDALLYSPVETIFGTSVTVTPATTASAVTISAVDESKGVEIGYTEGGAVIVKPAALFRSAALTNAGLALSDLKRAALSMNGKTYRIDSAYDLPTPNGTGDGQVRAIRTET